MSEILKTMLDSVVMRSNEVDPSRYFDSLPDKILKVNFEKFKLISIPTGLKTDEIEFNDALLNGSLLHFKATDEFFSYIEEILLEFRKEIYTNGELAPEIIEKMGLEAFKDLYLKKGHYLFLNQIELSIANSIVGFLAVKWISENNIDKENGVCEHPFLKSLFSGKTFRLWQLFKAANFSEDKNIQNIIKLFVEGESKGSLNKKEIQKLLNQINAKKYSGFKSLVLKKIEKKPALHLLKTIGSNYYDYLINKGKNENEILSEFKDTVVNEFFIFRQKVKNCTKENKDKEINKLKKNLKKNLKEVKSLKRKTYYLTGELNRLKLKFPTDKILPIKGLNELATKLSNQLENNENLDSDALIDIFYKTKLVEKTAKECQTAVKELKHCCEIKNYQETLVQLFNKFKFLSDNEPLSVRLAMLDYLKEAYKKTDGALTQYRKKYVEDKIEIKVMFNIEEEHKKRKKHYQLLCLLYRLIKLAAAINFLKTKEVIFIHYRNEIDMDMSFNSLNNTVKYLEKTLNVQQYFFNDKKGFNRTDVLTFTQIPNNNQTSNETVFSKVKSDCQTILEKLEILQNDPYPPLNFFQEVFHELNLLLHNFKNILSCVYCSLSSNEKNDQLQIKNTWDARYEIDKGINYLKWGAGGLFKSGELVTKEEITQTDAHQNNRSWLSSL